MAPCSGPSAWRLHLLVGSSLIFKNLFCLRSIDRPTDAEQRPNPKLRHVQSACGQAYSTCVNDSTQDARTGESVFPRQLNVQHVLVFQLVLLDMQLGRRSSAPCGSSPFALSVVLPAQLLRRSPCQKRPVEQKTLR